MSMINVTFVGYLARDPEQICFASGKIKTVIVVAINSQIVKKGEKEETADFYKVETWGRLAELSHKYLHKGNQVAVCGKLVMDHWTDKDGKARVTPVVSATQISFPPKLSSSSSARAGGMLSADDDDDLFAGARAVTVAEPPADYYFPSTSLAACAVAAGR